MLFYISFALIKRRSAIKRCSLLYAVNQKRSQIYVYCSAILKPFSLSLSVTRVRRVKRPALGKWRTSFRYKRLDMQNNKSGNSNFPSRIA
ncbi:hypothetical protein CDAR_176461 [Caerostris darwini]|uniref:Uncharacterized protein n=1 Tax=Caerostris darwini TaxID=1538125 RepID=A0AAV4Q5C9_9ARAC|nr:hypothetical protein CDAR_176461 [Caerostris darwini]